MIRLRPHHGMCLLNFRGMGYSPEFTEKMTAVSELLRREPETAVSVSDGADDLCAVCPHCVDGKCASDNPAVFDRRVAEAAGMHPGDVVNIPPEVKHWHGAAPDSWFAHIAIEVPAAGASNEWCEPVTDAAYNKLK